MEEKYYKELSEKLDTIIKLLAMQSLGDKTGREAISLLANIGFQPRDIATMIGTTPNTVSVALSEMKKKRKG
jgi:DNA-binding CsgD family transcriptional regulator